MTATTGEPSKINAIGLKVMGTLEKLSGALTGNEDLKAQGREHKLEGRQESLRADQLKHEQLVAAHHATDAAAHSQAAQPAVLVAPMSTVTISPPEPDFKRQTHMHGQALDAVHQQVSQQAASEASQFQTGNQEQDALFTSGGLCASGQYEAEPDFNSQAQVYDQFDTAHQQVSQQTLADAAPFQTEQYPQFSTGGVSSSDLNEEEPEFKKQTHMHDQQLDAVHQQAAQQAAAEAAQFQREQQEQVVPFTQPDSKSQVYRQGQSVDTVNQQVCREAAMDQKAYLMTNNALVEPDFVQATHNHDSLDSIHQMVSHQAASEGLIR